MEYRVHTEVLTVSHDHPEQDIIDRAAATLREGKLVAFPTETVYGLGANALNHESVGLVYAVKRRPASDPLIVHLASKDAIDMIATGIPPLARTLVDRFWPGPLTLILRRHHDIPPVVSGGLPTVAVRMPRHPVALALIRAAGIPVAAPSANLFMHPSPTSADHVLEDLQGHVDVILDAGPTPIGVESTVVDVLQDPPVLLRPGGATVEDLRTIIPSLVVHPAYLSTNNPAQRSPSPGMLARHYSPNASLVLFAGFPSEVIARIHSSVAQCVNLGMTVGILSSEEDLPRYAGLPAVMRNLGSRQNLHLVGRNLFNRMRDLDKSHVDVIFVGEFSVEGIGLAIRDRMIRASAGRIVDAANARPQAVQLGTHQVHL